MVREYHGQLAGEAGDAGLARAVAEIAPRVYELSEFLVDVLGVTDVGAYFPHRVTYHPTCHSLRMLRVGDAPAAAAARGARARPGRAAATRRPAAGSAARSR